MQSHSYYKIGASGNTTLFLPVKDVDRADRLLLLAAMGPQGVGAEQAAFVDIQKRRVEMAGGEFCANACRAMGALLDLHEPDSRQSSERHYRIRISGMDSPVDLEVKGSKPVWEISAAFNLKPISLQKDGNLCNLPGISHLLIETENLPSPEDASGLAESMVSECNTGQPALGLVWWRKSGECLDILPYVMVPSAGTAMVENACGSASMALALALHGREGQEKFSIVQPSGEKLFCQVKGDSLLLKGRVSLCSAGELWLEMDFGNP